MKTIFCDIDGTLIEHLGNGGTQHLYPARILPFVTERLLEWDKRNYRLILVTGRKESVRAATEKQLLEIGIMYDQLIMGVGSGERILINDKKSDGTETCRCFNLNRNEGLGKVNV